MNKTLYLSLISYFLFLVLLASPANAANLSNAFLRLDRMTASTATGGTICAKMATTTGTDAKLNITFPTGFTVNGTATNWTVTTTNLPAGASAMPGVGTASLVSSQTVTFPISDISNNTTLYCFNFAAANTLTTAGTPASDLSGFIQITTSADAEIDSAYYATAVITSDQVLITATVPPTFSFALGTNTQALGTLSSTAVTSGTGVSVTLGTNAAKGWLTWVKSLYAYLNSVAATDTIPTTGTVDDAPSTLSTGTEGYVLDCNLTTDSATAGTGTVTIDPEYNGTTTSQGGTLATTFQEVATANGPTDNDVVTLVPRVAISALTKAANDYTDTLTVVGAANF